MREDGQSVSVYMVEKKIGDQNKWAAAQAIRYALLPDEGGAFTLKELAGTRSWHQLSAEDASTIIRKEQI